MSLPLTTLDEAVAGALEAHRLRLRLDAARLLRGSGEDPEDVLQDVHERVLVAARSGVTGWEALPYLRRAVRNRCVDVLRARAARPASVELATDLPDGDGDPAVVAVERLAELVADLRALPDRQREALLAAVLDAPAGSPASGAAKMLIVRARRNLRVLALARAMPCHEVRAALAASAERGVRSSELVRRHVLSCPACQAHRARRGIAALFAPLLAWLGSLGSELGAAKLLAVVAITSGTVPIVAPHVRDGDTATAEPRPRHVVRTRAADPPVPARRVFAAPTPSPSPRPLRTQPARAPVHPAPTPRPRVTSSTELRKADLAKPKVKAALDRSTTPQQQATMTLRQKQLAAYRRLREERRAARKEKRRATTPPAATATPPPAATPTPPPAATATPPPAPTPTATVPPLVETEVSEPPPPGS